MAGALDGVRILDLSWGIAGPLGVTLLAEQGADVIKVEPPGGDPFRSYSGYAMWNRSRRSVTVDLKRRDGLEAVLRLVEDADVLVETFGPGWGTRSVWGDEQIRVINRSVINLGMGGIGYSETLTNVKTRDFEIPGTGGGMYLTTHNDDLIRHFDVGREIACYRSREDMLEQIRRHLAHPEEAAEMSRRARERCLREHRWLHRYGRILELLGTM